MEKKKGSVDDKILLGSKLGEFQMNSFNVQNLALMEIYPKQSFNFFPINGRVKRQGGVSFHNFFWSETSPIVP